MRASSMRAQGNIVTSQRQRILKNSGERGRGIDVASDEEGVKKTENPPGE
jgi:hypothetical protein